MKCLKILVMLSVSFVWVAGSRGGDLIPATAVAVYDENGDALSPVPSVMPLQDVLGAYGASVAAGDPSLPAFLERAIDLADPTFRNGDVTTVDESILNSYTDENGGLIQETLDIPGGLGAAAMILRLSSEAGGALGIDLTLVDSQGVPTERAFLFQVFIRQADGTNIVGALPGKCRCSKKTVAGCTTNMCYDGDTCPGHNGESCGFYTGTLL